ncbi:hypothetical protein EON65_51340 [archaeon]|nr:MAG: hypothetical protein EON65_51340 [archaeon]
MEATSGEAEPPLKKSRKNASKKKVKVESSVTIAPGLQIHRCNRDAHLKIERRFKWRLSTDIKVDGCVVLDAWVLDNNLAVFILPTSLDVISLTYAAPLEGPSSTKLQPKKATAAVAQGMQCVASVVTTDHTTMQLLAPLSGRLIEYNDRLADQPALLKTSYDGDGYIAICQSDTIKLIERCKNLSVSLEQVVNTKNTNICFAWAKTGICRKGKNCRFDHG